MDKQVLTLQEQQAINAINSLSSASVQLSKLAKIFVKYAGKAPTITELLNISYAYQKKPQLIAEVASRLLGVYAHDRPQTLSHLNGKIAELGRLLNKFSASKFKELMEQHLSIKSDGTVYLSERAQKRIKSGN